MMGYRTPNIDRIASEGALFTDWYGQQSCTAGRAAFITGAVADPHRAHQGRPAGRTGGHEEGGPDDRDAAAGRRATRPASSARTTSATATSMLPTTHGFDEFFGNLYHLNAEEEPENPDYPKNPEFRKKFGPRGVIHSFADGRRSRTPAR